MSQWVTLNDRGYRIVRADDEPDNAVRGPYTTHDEAVAAMDREEMSTTRALGALLALWVGVLLACGGWMVIQWVAGSVR